MSSIAVVILNYNGKAYLEKFLPGVIQYSPEATIVVADNGSSDGSLSYLRENFPGVTLIDNGKNLGFCGGYNAALKKVDADYFVLLNNDVEVTPGWLAPMKDILDKHWGAAAIQPKILSYHDKTRFDYAGAGGGYIDILGYPFCRGRVFDTIEQDKGQYNDDIPVFWASGACMMIRSYLFKEHGGFDEDLFAHMEEIDLCWRLKRDGNYIYYCGGSTVYHVGGGTLAAANPRKTYYNFRNGLDIIIKHLPGPKLIWRLPLRILLDWVAAFRFIFGSPSHAWAVVRAHWYVLMHLGRIISKRRKLATELKGFETGNVFPGIAVWRFYIRGMHYYPLTGGVPPFRVQWPWEIIVDRVTPHD